MPITTYSLYARTLALIDATPWGQDSQRTFLEEIWPKIEIDYEEMVAKLVKRCQKIVCNEGIAAMVEGRVKTRHSIQLSLNRREQHRLKNNQPACSNFEELLSEIHDLAGIRIVVDLPHDLEATSRLISATRTFHPKGSPNEFKADRSVGKLWRHWFGAYECINHHVTAQFPTHDSLEYYNNILFEIQVTTLAASLYNRIAHPLHYKNQAGELSRGDEIVIDLTRGVSLCYSLCLYYMHDKLDRKEIEFMRRQVSSDQGARPESINEYPEMIVPDIPELRDTSVKDVPASMFRRALENLSLRPGEATPSRVWDSFGHNLRSAIELMDIRNKAISKLPFEQMDSREISIESASEDTCHWILDIFEYKSWQGKESGCDAPPFFWIIGKAGAGKSTAMKFLVKEKRANAGYDTVFSFFFNARGSREEKSTMGLYRALLYHLFRAEPGLCIILDELGKVYLESTANSGWKKESALKEILRSALASRQSQSRLYCFIDALDECPESQVRDMLDLFQSCSGTRNLGRVRFCLASRPYPEIGIQSCHKFFLNQSPGHYDDIRAYIDPRLARFDIQQPDLTRLKEEILLKSSGIFMWVVLVIRILEEATDDGTGHSLDLLKRKLAETPADLHELFRDIITRDGDISARLYLTLQWTLHARHPLTPVEFCAAIWISEGRIDDADQMSQKKRDLRKFLLSASKGLVEITRTEDPRVQFLHQSVRDFLLADGKFIESNFGDKFEGQSHHTLAKACSSRIGSASGSMELPLCSYAHKWVFYHADNAQRRGLHQESFISNFPLQSWRFNLPPLYGRSSNEHETSLLYLLAEHGAKHLIPLCPGRASHLKSIMKGGRWNYAAFAAIWWGKYGSLSALFEFGPSEDRRIRSFGRKLNVAFRYEGAVDNGNEPLCCGIPIFLQHGDCHLVRLILESDQYDAPCSRHGFDTGRFFRRAASEEVMDLWFEFSSNLHLLESHSFDKDNNAISTHNLQSRIWCHGAKLMGHCGELNRRTSSLVGVSETTLDGCNIIWGISGFLDVLKTSFLSVYTNPWGHSELRASTGLCASESLGSKSLEHLQRAFKRCPQLLQSVTWEKHTFLYHAIRKDFKQLIETGIEEIIRTRDNIGATKAAVASVTSYDGKIGLRRQIIERLLDASFTLDGPSLLHHAVRCDNNLAMVKVLLHEFTRIDVNCKDDRGRTALQIALEGYRQISVECIEVIRELLEAGGDPNYLSDNDTTMLQYAAAVTDSEANLAFVQLILEKVSNIQVEARDKEGRTALGLAVRKGHSASVRVLLQAGASPEGSELLEYCLDNDEVKTLDALLSSHLLIGTRDLDMYGLLKKAARKGERLYMEGLLRLDGASTILTQVLLEMENENLSQ